MYQVIARKYRPQSFAELLGQEHVRTTLERAIAQGRIAHGYIFSGQRGTGKTTVARIVARCLNCIQGPTTTPCGECASCKEISGSGAVDVIEIDAASNRGINEMRELRENVRYRPARDRYKIFIIDEAHQITSEAFNALLKTLEEPPEWVIFILCTTEAHKIPTTIASRCQQFSFRSVAFEELVSRMEWICRQEGIEADPESLAVLAQAGEGSVRDSLSALDQAIACCGGRLEAQQVRSLLGMFALETLQEVTEALLNSDAARMLDIVDRLESNGRNLQHFCRELARYFRNLLVVRIAGKDTHTIVASPGERQRLAETAARFEEIDLTRYLQLTLDLFRDLQYSLQPRLHMEIGLLKLIHAGKLKPIEEALASLPAAQAAPAAAPSTPRPAGAAPVSPARSAAISSSGDMRQRLLAYLKDRQMTFVADAVEHSEVVEDPGEVIFRAPKEFGMALRSQDLQRAVREVAGRALKITVENGAAGPAAEPDRTESPPEEGFMRKILEHPEVRRFQELFPSGQVRQVRNLKE
jgi:DNA polymerase-3 subunit gamma/tau